MLNDKPRFIIIIIINFSFNLLCISLHLESFYLINKFSLPILHSPYESLFYNNICNITLQDIRNSGFIEKDLHVIATILNFSNMY